jgi:hypothetical protein
MLHLVNGLNIAGNNKLNKFVILSTLIFYMCRTAMAESETETPKEDDLMDTGDEGEADEEDLKKAEGLLGSPSTHKDMSEIEKNRNPSVSSLVDKLAITNQSLNPETASATEKIPNGNEPPARTQSVKDSPDPASNNTGSGGGGRRYRHR